MGKDKEKFETIKVSEEDIGHKRILCRYCGRFVMKVSRDLEGEVELNCPNDKCKRTLTYNFIQEKL